MRDRTWGERALGAALGPLRRAREARARLAPRRRTSVEEIDGVPIIVLPDVFNPASNRTGCLLARSARDAIRPRPVGAAPARVLDLGTGTGIAAVFAALRGAEVVAVDLNPEAVRNARLNAQLHHVEHRVDVRQGDLLAPVRGQRFDLVLFDPPRYRGRPSTFLDLAWQSENVLERFADGLPGVLAPGGEARFVVSTDADSEGLPALLRAQGFALRELSSRTWLGAVEAVYVATR